VQTLHVELEVPVTVEPTGGTARGGVCHGQRMASAVSAETQATGTTSTSYDTACPRSQNVSISAQALNLPMQKLLGDEAVSARSRDCSQGQSPSNRGWLPGVGSGQPAPRQYPTPS